MKTSNKCLSVLIVALFLGTALLMGVVRMLMGREPAAVAAEIVDAGADQSGDSSVAVVPGAACTVKPSNPVKPPRLV